MGGRKKVKTKETGEPSAAKKPRKQRKSRRSSVEEETTVLMDETIWKELPEELLESVIARVPIATFIRFRLVRHKWNSLPFLHRWAPQELPLIYVLISDGMLEKLGALYDPLVKKWHYISQAPPYYLISHAPPYYYYSDGPRCDSGGLVCYADFGHDSFRVGNLLTRTWKVIPWSAKLGKRAFALAFVYNPSGGGGYKIVWLDLGGNYGVYDYSSSEDKTTITQGRIPANFEQPLPIGSKGLAIGSVVYFQCKEPEGIMSYDMVRGTWEQLLVAYPPNSRIVSLAEGGGRLLLVGWVDCNKNNNNAARIRIIRPCVCVWELDMQMRSWIEVDRMPTSYWPYFENFVKGVCLSNRRLLVILLSGWLLKRITRRRAQVIFAYDVVSQEWSKVPEPILPWAQEICSGISFIPCLSASP